MYFSCNVSFSSLPVFLPTILSEMGFSAINAQGLSAPPYFLAFLLVILTTWIADRTQQRGYMIIFTSTIGAIGYILLVNATITKSLTNRIHTDIYRLPPHQSLLVTREYSSRLRVSFLL